MYSFICEEIMASPIDPAKLAEGIAQYQKWLNEVRATIPPGPAATEFQQLVQQFDKASAQLNQEYPKEMQRLAEKEKEINERMEALKAQMEAQAGARQQAAAAPAASKAPALDPLLDKKLHDELFGEFGRRPAYSKDNPPPPRRPTAGKESYEWESSKEWETKGI